MANTDRLAPPGEESLGERGDEVDLDEQADDRLGGGNDGYGVSQILHRLEEAAPLEIQHLANTSGRRYTAPMVQ